MPKPKKPETEPAKKPVKPRATKAGASAASEPPLGEAGTNESIADQVRRQHGLILGAFALGHSLTDIGKQLCKPPLSSISIRATIEADTALKAAYEAAKEHRAHEYIELAGDAGRTLVSSLLTAKDGADILLKVAAKTAPALYGDKKQVALTGADDGPVKVDVTQTPSEAYRAMLGKVKT
jgi:hypothetical protein